MPLSCRFYQEKFPDIEDTVVANVVSIQEMGAYVRLLEYNNIEGMILLSELSRRRIRSVNKLVRVGRNESVVVIRVDKDKGYIDLSKRRVYAKDLLQCEDRFAKAKAVNSILRHVADQLGYDEDTQLEDLYDRTAWHFDRQAKRKAASYDIFKKAIQDPTVLDECDISADVKEKLLEDIRKRLTPSAVKIRADIEVSCFGYEGIDAVKNALREGLKCSSDELPIKVNLIAPPHYVVTATTLERAEGLAIVNTAIERIREAVDNSHGAFKVLQPPKVVTDLDEEEIKKKMEEMGIDVNDLTEGDENEEGMTAPKGLDEQFDAENVPAEANGDDDDDE